MKPALRLVALAALCSCAPQSVERPSSSAPAASSASSRRERALAALVDEQRAVESVRTLVDFGTRMGGTRSGERACAWLAERFRAAGLEAIVLEDDEAWATEALSWSLVARADARGDEPGGPELRLERAWPFGFSPSSRGSAELVLAPRPGACLLTSERPSSELLRGGDIALCLVDGRTIADGSWPVPSSLGAPRSGGSRPFPAFGLSTPEGATLRAWLEAGRVVRVEWSLEMLNRRARPRTVVATLPAREGAPEGYFLFCAHGDSDSGGPGANDNASGEAVLLEIASAWAAAVRAGLVEAPPRAVRFAVWGVEIRSTRHFLERRGDELGRPLGVINFDQAGFGAGADQLNVEPDDLPSNRALVEAALGVLRDHAGDEGFPARWATNRSLGGTDSYVFSGDEDFRAAGRPAVTLFSSAWGEPAEHPRTPGMPGESWRERELVAIDHDPYYHSAGDRPELTTDTEPWNMAWCARVGLLTARRWLAELER